MGLLVSASCLKANKRLRRESGMSSVWNTVTTVKHWKEVWIIHQLNAAAVLSLFQCRRSALCVAKECLTLQWFHTGDVHFCASNKTHFTSYSSCLFSSARHAVFYKYGALFFSNKEAGKLNRKLLIVNVLRTGNKPLLKNLLFEWPHDLCARTLWLLHSSLLQMLRPGRPLLGV